MSTPQFIKELLERSVTEGSRSNVMGSLTWLAGLLLTATIASFNLSLPLWLSIAISVFTGIVIIAWLITFFYLLIKDRDSLRSEKFTIQKLAIQKGLYGDNVTGLINSDDLQATRLLLAKKSGAKEDES